MFIGHYFQNGSKKEVFMRARQGFTLIEILIVVVILGVLAAMVIPVFGQAGTDAKLSAVTSNLQKVRLQIELYKNRHNGLLPGTGGNATFEQSLTAQTDMYGNLGGPYGGYLERLPVNSFNHRQDVRLDGDAAGANQAGWRFDSATGQFCADDSAEHALL
jgi:general secretion pathway protein G